MNNIDFFVLSSIFFSGLLGGVHCVGMCGGIVSALSINNSHHFLNNMSYNLGRILSYVVAGGIVGLLGASSQSLNQFLPIQQILFVITQILLILLGLYIAQFSSILIHLEQVGQSIWIKIQPLSKKFMPVQNFRQAFILGMIWGWLPCGLVYTALINAFSSASSLNGSLIMLSFGLGTLPNLLAMSFFSHQIKRKMQSKWVKRTVGSIILSFGIFGLIRFFINYF